MKANEKKMLLTKKMDSHRVMRARRHLQRAQDLIGFGGNPTEQFREELEDHARHGRIWLKSMSEEECRSILNTIDMEDFENRDQIDDNLLELMNDIDIIVEIKRIAYLRFDTFDKVELSCELHQDFNEKFTEYLRKSNNGRPQTINAAFRFSKGSEYCSVVALDLLGNSRPIFCKSNLKWQQVQDFMSSSEHVQLTRSSSNVFDVERP